MTKATLMLVAGAGLCLSCLGLLCVGANAGQLTYRPTNPTFGGNPLNGNFLLSTAQTQGDGVKSGQQQAPDLSGLNDALENIGDVGGEGSAPIIIIGDGDIPPQP